jgi:cyclopropane fatty-acyl-phospholipid synthase-like methyltransferase
MVEDDLPFSQASENNKLPILQVLTQHLPAIQSLLEIGGGTGQHAVFFAAQFPNLRWQSSDLPTNVYSLNLRLQRASLPLALALDVNDSSWGVEQFDAIFSANSLHIMSPSSVEKFFVGVGHHLKPAGLLFVYGPFKYGGDFTSDSNVQFDLWLKHRDPLSGIRDFEWINKLAQAVGLRLLQDNSMPANNQLLVWRRAGD